VSAAERAEMIQLLEDTPARLRRAVEGLVEGQLETPYRPGGWTVRQVVHHVPDSHINAYVRFRLALTESTPAIKTYEEHLWAELPDARTAPLEISLPLLEALHRRWTLMLRALDEAQWKRPFRHPEMGEMALEQSLAHYAWHSRHHVAHITRLRERLGWV
jgi:uncharacterized damage-inducible protein DinB